MANRSLSNAGLGLALLSGATFGISGPFAASLIAVGWTPGAAVAARVLVAAVVLTVPALLQLRTRRVTARGLRSVVSYGLVAVAGAQLCYFNAVEHLSVAVAMLIEYSGILLVIAWMWARHGHRPRRLTVAGSTAALIGLVFVLDLVGSHHIDGIGMLWGFGAAVGLAVYFVVSSRSDDALPPLVVAWGGLAVAAVVLGLAIGAGALPAHAVATDVTLVQRHVSWVVPVLGMALVAGVVAYASGIAAARLLGAKVASFVGLTEVLFAIVFAWLLLGQQLNAIQGVGALLVVGGIALVRIDELGHPGGALVRPPATGATPTVTLAGTARGRPSA
jgi:drug/metabolite transporter (DMT)-like permease